MCCRLLTLFAILCLPLMAQAGDGDSIQAFTVQEIPDSVWLRMQGKTYLDNPHIGRCDLRYLRLLHYDLEGNVCQGEMVCNKLIADRLLDIFRQLYEARYPIERIQLADDFDADDERQMQANNTSCFCYRVVAGSTKLSKHARGLAVDINPLYNPCVRRRNGKLNIEPATAVPYVDRTGTFPCKIDTTDLAYRLFTANGFTWGGSWRTVKDYQHFEFAE